MAKLLVRVKIYLVNEDGSISLLIFFMFLMLLVLTFTITNISYAGLAKRELVQIGQAAVSYGAHEIDLNRYYENGIISNAAGYSQVPLDCPKALDRATSFLFTNNLRGSKIDIAKSECAADKITLLISSKIDPGVMWANMKNKLEVKALVSATSIVK